MYVRQQNTEVRPCTNIEWKRAVLIGKRVKISSDPDRYGYLHNEELYVNEETAKGPREELLRIKANAKP